MLLRHVAQAAVNQFIVQDAATVSLQEKSRQPDYMTGNGSLIYRRQSEWLDLSMNNAVSVLQQNLQLRFLHLKMQELPEQGHPGLKHPEIRHPVIHRPEQQQQAVLLHRQIQLLHSQVQRIIQA